MANNNTLLQLADQQQNIFKNLITDLYNKSLAGLNETRRQVNDLYRRHRLYHSNFIQIRNLKTEINAIQERYDLHIRNILNQIEEQKQRAKEILLNALKQLESIVNTQNIRMYLNELIHSIGDLAMNMSANVFLFQIFSGFGLFALIVAILALSADAFVSGVATLGLGFVVGGTASEVTFRTKLTQLDEKLGENITNLQSQKYERIQKIDEYFNNFKHRLKHCHTDDQNSMVNIVWYDKNIQNYENQCCLQLLKDCFPEEQYQLLGFDSEYQSISSILSNITKNVILITSGSTGEQIISEIGYYFHIQGIIIYCKAVEYHRAWANKYKRVLLVTDIFSEVTDKIRDIEHGQIYFVNYGFSFDDITIKFTKPDYYLSTKQNGFICSSFSSINSNIDYHTNIMNKLHNALKSKNIYPKGIPSHFQLANLLLCAQRFVQALQAVEPEKSLIRLYTAEAPYYYKIINDILNLLDEELILIIQDYIKALRYALIKYIDTSNKIPNGNNVRFYRGICLRQNNSFEEFSRKFKIHDIIIFPAFSSTSLNKNEALTFMKGEGVLLDISADCTQANKPKYISAESAFYGEDEVLLNCFSILTVKKITKMNEKLLRYKCTLELR